MGIIVLFVIGLFVVSFIIGNLLVLSKAPNYSTDSSEYLTAEEMKYYEMKKREQEREKEIERKKATSCF